MRVESLLEVAPLAADRVEPFHGTRPYLATGGLSDDSSLASEAVTYEQRPSRADLTVRAGDVCFARMQGTEKVLEFDGEHADLILSTGFAVLRPKSSQVHSGFLRHWMRTREFQSTKDRLCTGATQKAITNEKMEKLTIPLPNLEKQKQIAGVLDRAQVLRAKRFAVLAQLDTFSQSSFLEMFGNPISNPKSFKTTNLGDVIRLTGGFAFKSTDYCATGIPLVRIGEVNRGGATRDDACFLPTHFATEYARFLVRPGDMLMSLTGTTGKEDYGNVVLLNDTFGEYLLNQRVAWLQPDEKQLSKLYLLYVLRYPKVKIKLTAKSRGIRQANISNGDVKELQIPLPSLKLQQDFARRVVKIEKLKVTHGASLGEFDALFASLQHNAFRGKL